MGNYSDDAASVRVDFFKESGKWYCTEAVKWTGKYNKHSDLPSNIDDGWDVVKQFAVSLKNHLGSTTRLQEMVAVCIEPYHEHGFPLMIKVNSLNEIINR